MTARFIVFVLVSLIPAILGIASGDPTSLSFTLTRESEPYVDSVTSWMVENTSEKVLDSGSVRASSDDEVRQYFQMVRRLAEVSRTAGASSAEAVVLRQEVDSAQPSVEAAIQREVASAAGRSGVGFRLGGSGLLPPVFFRFQAPPNLLVASPRSKIEREATVLLKPRLSVETQEAIEARTANRNTSTLVTAIGGLGVYPSMVPESSDPRWTFRTVAHEWTHQFLALRPLGVRYALGDENDPRMITVNETTAEVVGTELGDQVYAKYYPEAQEATQPGQSGQSGRDATFRGMMREIRTKVDALLAEGDIGEAERFMDASRDNLQANGFYIRKLNQAYFAFYGSYAEDPSAAGRSGSEISDGIRGLRQRSGSLGDFLWKLSDVSSFPAFLAVTTGN